MGDMTEKNSQKGFLKPPEKDDGTIYRITEKLEMDIKKEKDARMRAEADVKNLSQALSEAKRDLRDAESYYHASSMKVEEEERDKICNLKEQNEKISAENFEYAVENDQLKSKIQEQLEMEKKMKKEISNLRLEKQRLKNSYDLQEKESLEKDIGGEDTDA